MKPGKLFTSFISIQKKTGETKSFQALIPKSLNSTAYPSDFMGPYVSISVEVEAAICYRPEEYVWLLDCLNVINNIVIHRTDGTQIAFRGFMSRFVPVHDTAEITIKVTDKVPLTSRSRKDFVKMAWTKSGKSPPEIYLTIWQTFKVVNREWLDSTVGSVNFEDVEIDGILYKEDTLFFKTWFEDENTINHEVISAKNWDSAKNLEPEIDFAVSQFQIYPVYCFEFEVWKEPQSHCPPFDLNELFPLPQPTLKGKTKESISIPTEGGHYQIGSGPLLSYESATHFQPGTILELPADQAKQLLKEGKVVEVPPF